MTVHRDQRFWDKLARKYSQDPVADQEGYERSLARTRSLLKPTDHLLEVGCGTGTTALAHADDVEQIVATDVSPAMIAIANEKLAQTPHTNVQFKAAPAEEPAVAPGSQDVVMAHNLLHLTRDLPRVLDVLTASLKPGGLLITKTPCVAELNPMLKHVMIPAMRLVGKAPYVDIFNSDTLKRQIVSAGYANEADERHGTPDRGRDVRAYLVARKLS
ncbi:MAG: class I SAM-dependent methyltransferase [Pseudomonadota bacterium]